MFRCIFLLVVFALPLFAEEKSPVIEPTTHEEVTTEKEYTFADEVEEKKAPDFKQLFLKTVVLLVAFTGLVFGGTWLARKISGGRLDSFSSEGNIRLLERKYLSPKSSLWLVEVMGRKLVVIDSQAGVALHPLKEIPEEGDASV